MTSWVYQLNINDLENLAKILNLEINEDKIVSNKTGLPISRTDKFRAKISKALSKFPRANEYLKNNFVENESPLAEFKIKIEQVLIQEAKIEEEKRKREEEARINQEKIDEETRKREVEDRRNREIKELLEIGKSEKDNKMTATSSQTFNFQNAPKFSGNEEEDVDYFLKAVESHAKHGKFDPKTILLNGLTGEALDYFLDLENSNTESLVWSTIKQNFLSKFRQTDAAILRRITTTKQGALEKPTEFMRKILKYCQQLEAKPNEAIQIEYIIDGLREEVRKAVIFHQDKRLDTFKGRLRAWEQDEKITKDNKKGDTKDELEEIREELKRLKIEQITLKKKSEEDAETIKKDAETIKKMYEEKNQKNQNRSRYRNYGYGRRGNNQGRGFRGRNGRGYRGRGGRGRGFPNSYQENSTRQNQNNQGQSERLPCSACNMNNHTDEECWWNQKN